MTCCSDGVCSSSVWGVESNGVGLAPLEFP